MKFGRLLLHAVLLLAAAVTLIPFLWMACASIKPVTDFFTSLFLPGGTGWGGIAWDRLTLENFARLGETVQIWRSLWNSVFLASLISLGATMCAAAGGYALARFQFRGRFAVTRLVLGALLIPGPLLLAPGYELIWRLGLLDTWAGLMLPALAPAFGLYLFRQATLQSVPIEMLEAARIDGAGEGRMFFTIALPMLRPMVGAFLLLSFLGAWNNFIGPQLILQDPVRHPLSVAINQLRGLYATDYGLIMAGTLVSITPVLALFLLLQREFLAGLTAGAVKG